jgi:hypothetical protein
MENLEWKTVYYNDLETNVEVTKCGRVRRIKTSFYGNYNKYCKTGEVNFNELKLSKGYLCLGIKIKSYGFRTCQVQQLIAAAFLDYNWNGHKNVVMHLDDNPKNNILSNLKIGTTRDNFPNKISLKNGLPKGVTFISKSKKYRSAIRFNNKKIHLGCFNTIEEASNAYQEKLKSLC